MRMLALMLVHRWGRGAVGSAPRWHRGGRGFESHRLHQNFACPFTATNSATKKGSCGHGRSVLRPCVILPWLGSGGDGIDSARGLPQGDVGFEFAHHFVEGG